MPWMGQASVYSPEKFPSQGVEIPHLCFPDPFNLLSLSSQQQSRPWESLTIHSWRSLLVCFALVHADPQSSTADLSLYFWKKDSINPFLKSTLTPILQRGRTPPVLKEASKATKIHVGLHQTSEAPLGLLSGSCGVKYHQRVKSRVHVSKQRVSHYWQNPLSCQEEQPAEGGPAAPHACHCPVPCPRHSSTRTNTRRGRALLCLTFCHDLCLIASHATFAKMGFDKKCHVPSILKANKCPFRSWLSHTTHAWVTPQPSKLLLP